MFTQKLSVSSDQWGLQLISSKKEMQNLWLLKENKLPKSNSIFANNIALQESHKQLFVGQPLLNTTM